MQTERIDIPEEFRRRVLSRDPVQALDTLEIVEYYRAQGLAEADARQAARQVALQLVAEGAELVRGDSTRPAQ